MWFFSARLSATAAGIALLLLRDRPHASTRGSQAGYDAPWNLEHIDRLPPEVRNAVIRTRRDRPRAGHDFATCFDNSHFDEVALRTSAP
jgi:hypothetical protein